MTDQRTCPECGSDQVTTEHHQKFKVKTWQERMPHGSQAPAGYYMQTEITELRAALAERDAEIEHYIDQYEMLLRYNEANLSERATLRAALTAALEMKHE